MLGSQDQPIRVGRCRYDATVLTNQQICREHLVLRLVIKGEFPLTYPGQFVQLSCRPPASAMDIQTLAGTDRAWRVGTAVGLKQLECAEPMALLRRPFSLARRGDDDQGTWIDIIHRVVGVGTAWLADLEPGDQVDLIGPLGNRFELPKNKSLGLLVGGGVGLPPMFYLASEMQRAGWEAVSFVGAMSADLLAATLDTQIRPDRSGRPSLCVHEFGQVGYPTVVTTDDGSLGLHGRVTLALAQYLESLNEAQKHIAVIFTCGPEPMMRAVAALACDHGVDAQVCLEQAMACGLGTCQSCVAKIETAHSPHGVCDDGRLWRYRLTCTDGPVFSAGSVVW